jgi:hypothetical protein
MTHRVATRSTTQGGVAAASLRVRLPASCTMSSSVAVLAKRVHVR